ncbi:MAG: hypothetical protein ABIQ27_12870, partial [Flavobacterium sp.]|uniref:hypothetical protein n=1 Tax=Flavobacterium sp. TaxID=239 RepID=UPI0032678C01
METIILPKHETQLVVDHIVKAFSPCTIFTFGYSNNSTSASSLLLAQTNDGSSSHHFYLVVFSNKAFQNGGSNIANAIAE